MATRKSKSMDVVSITTTPVPHDEGLLPSEAWDADTLAGYIRDRMENANHFRRKTALELWLAGKGLSMAKGRLRAAYGDAGQLTAKWNAWCLTEGFGISTANNLVKLAEAPEFQHPKDLEGHTPKEAKMLAGILPSVTTVLSGKPKGKGKAKEASKEASPLQTAMAETVGGEMDKVVIRLDSIVKEAVDPLIAGRLNLRQLRKAISDLETLLRLAMEAGVTE